MISENADADDASHNRPLRSPTPTRPQLAGALGTYAAPVFVALAFVIAVPEFLEWLAQYTEMGFPPLFCDYQLSPVPPPPLFFWELLP
jgi:hypothetical protein